MSFTDLVIAVLFTMYIRILVKGYKLVETGRPTDENLCTEMYMYQLHFAVYSHRTPNVNL